jgi:hypothetical protein
LNDNKWLNPIFDLTDVKPNCLGIFKLFLPVDVEHHAQEVKNEKNYNYVKYEGQFIDRSLKHLVIVVYHWVYSDTSKGCRQDEGVELNHKSGLVHFVSDSILSKVYDEIRHHHYYDG